jgi:hypothetical protein
MRKSYLALEAKWITDAEGTLIQVSQLLVAIAGRVFCFGEIPLTCEF